MLPLRSFLEAPSHPSPLSPFNNIHPNLSPYPTSLIPRFSLHPSLNNMKRISLKLPFFSSSKNKRRSVSRLDGASFGSSSASSSSATDDPICHRSSSTPKSVLPGAEITRRELEVVLRRLGPHPPTEDEVSAMLAEAGPGMTLAELVALGGEQDGDEELMKETFGVFDADGDGRISAEELMGVLVALGDEGCTIEDCRRMIGGVDSDADGFVCFDDFVRMMGSQR